MKEYDRGYKGFRSSRVANPHKEGSNKHREWQRGWNTAYFDNLEEVKQRESEKRS